MQACVATFLASHLKIGRFQTKQKMRLRTFDGDGETLRKRVAADIKDHLSATPCRERTGIIAQIWGQNLPTNKCAAVAAAVTPLRPTRNFATFVGDERAHPNPNTWGCRVRHGTLRAGEAAGHVPKGDLKMREMTTGRMRNATRQFPPRGRSPTNSAHPIATHRVRPSTDDAPNCRANGRMDG